MITEREYRKTRRNPASRMINGSIHYLRAMPGNPMSTLSLEQLVSSHQNARPLVMLVEAEGLLLFDGIRLSEEEGFIIDVLYRRLMHVSRWCNEHDEEFRFLHLWPDSEVLGQSFSREVIVRPFRGKRMAVSFGHVTPLAESTFRTGITSQVLDSLNSSMLVVEAECPRDGSGRRTLFASKGFEQMYGYAASEIVGRSPNILQGPDTDIGSIDTIRAALQEWRPLQVELVNHHKNGRRIDCQLRMAPVTDETGWYQYWVGFQEDAGERRRIAEELRMTQFVLKTMGVGIWRLDIATGELRWDDGMFEIYGISREDFKGRFEDWANRLVPEDAERAEHILRELDVNSDADVDTLFSILTPEGIRKNIAARSERLQIEAQSEQIIYGINVDRTQDTALKDTLEKQRGILERQDRYAAMGELAAGIGHEIRNPLQIALGHIEALKRHPEDIETSLTALEIAIERIQSISDGLRNFGRASSDQANDIFSVGQLITESLGLVEPVYKAESVRFVCRIEDTEALLVRGNRTRLQQVFLNLFANARDAMANSSVKEIRIFVRSLENMIAVDIEDTGPGIPPDVREQLFKVQVTTKALGKGSGIGLQMVKTIIDEFNGTIEICDEDRAGKGALFQVRLPQENTVACVGPQTETTETDTSGVRAESANSEHPPVRRLPDSILLVDDEDAIRQLLRLQLANLGVEVMEAASVSEALQRMETLPNGVDVVLCDLNMPGGSGPDLLRSALEKKLIIRRFILLTGSNSDDVGDATSDISDNIYAVLTKPFRFKEVLPYLDMNRP